MALPAQQETRTPWFTEDPFCACEGVKTLESTVHHDRLVRIEGDLRLHLEMQDLAYTITSDLLIRNVPLRAGLAPDIALWPGRQVLDPQVDYGSLALSAEWRPELVLEVTSESTVEADRDTKYEIYELAGITEYWLYDPMGYAGGPPLRGWRLTDAGYAPIEGRSATVAGEAVLLYPSTVLGTAWGLEYADELRLRDPVRADWYRMTPTTLRREQARADQEQARADQEQVRADQEQARADQAEARVRQEQARARQHEARLQQEMQRLRAQLNAQSDPN